MTRRLLLAVMLMSLTVGSSSCGYSLAGRGSFLPATSRRSAFRSSRTRRRITSSNRSSRSASEPSSSTGEYKVLPERGGVDAILLARLGLNHAASFTDQQQASRYVITVTAKIEFRDLKTNKVIWDNPSWTFRDDTEASAAVDALDPNAFFSQDANALERVSTEFAKSVVSAILEAF